MAFDQTSGRRIEDMTRPWYDLQAAHDRYILEPRDEILCGRRGHGMGHQQSGEEQAYEKVRHDGRTLIISGVFRNKKSTVLIARCEK